MLSMLFGEVDFITTYWPGMPVSAFSVVLAFLCVQGYFFKQRLCGQMYIYIL